LAALLATLLAAETSLLVSVSISVSVGGASAELSVVGGSTGRVSAVGSVLTVLAAVGVGLSFVLNGGPVSVLVSLVLDDLGAAVGEEDAVLALDVVTVAALFVSEIVAGFSVLHFIFELVLGGLLRKSFKLVSKCIQYAID
jgi:hypothetical protein